ncbi:hypothetical protein K1T71_003323 [Dendrolimus kikuchii]|uniref:Uncharacterized protein n=1 Tax=Dendrolimus kikuchii TaxID=765133 RepID=A0ACC1DBA4_9NEOP|nr:hypothetical protein K1T71_003323 [Dendrolimus kikuchii]
MDFNSFYFLVITVIKFLDNISISDTISDSHPDTGVEEDLAKILELFRSVIVNGCPEMDIPVLDPYEFDNCSGNFSEDILSYAIIIDNGIITGFSDFDVLGFNYDKLNLSTYLKVYFPLLRLQSEYYELDGNIFQILPIRGRGVMHFEIRNLTISSEVFFTQSINEKSLIIDYFEKTQFSIAKILAHTEIDNNIDEIFNAFVEDVLTDYLNRFNKYLSAKNSSSVAKALNKLLNKLESWHLIKDFTHSS